DRLTYRIERRAMERPSWEPEDASLTIVGQDTALLRLATNRNMLAIYSWSTPPGGVEAEVVDVGKGRDEDFARADVRGKIVFGEMNVGALYRKAVQEHGALGVLAYAMPAYTQPERYQRSIQFGSIPPDSARRSWGIALSYAARQALRAALAAGPVRARVATRTRIFPATELTVVADARGSVLPAERFVFTAHVQEPGANDNASGVGTQAEMARALAALVRRGAVDPKRTITFVWGLEITQTRRYLAEDTTRSRGVRWGVSLDMVGEDTRKTGGTFLIEKMPDPSAIWTRGDDRHTEWGAGDVKESDLRPHYFNDFILGRTLEQAAATGWVVRTNPFEGGSDHVPFIEHGKAGVLFWHFTDVFYHTDADRLDKVSPDEMRNVGVSALVAALALASADGETARGVVAETERAAMRRLAAEEALSAKAAADGGDRAKEARILRAWTDWYAGAIRAASDVETGGASAETRRAIDEAAARVERAGAEIIARIEGAAR
ncbi:MAG TPA: M28 family peptidase, partial [Gemmatimonadaceae bacterium]|nr:M28 family peptidase [Gemmatimonadaceae bacterium]